MGTSYVQTLLFKGKNDRAKSSKLSGTSMSTFTCLKMGLFISKLLAVVNANAKVASARGNTYSPREIHHGIPILQTDVTVTPTQSLPTELPHVHDHFAQDVPDHRNLQSHKDFVGGAISPLQAVLQKDSASKEKKKQHKLEAKGGCES